MQGNYSNANVFFGVGLCLAIFSICEVCRQCEALEVLGKTCSQSSVYRGTFTAYKAVDGNPNPNIAGQSCAVTEKQLHPWWRMDMFEEYCIQAITIVNRADACCAGMSVGATARAGLSSKIAENSVCGTPVTSSQARPGAWIEFVCDPPIQARWISLEIDHRESRSSVQLGLCEVMVTESNSPECLANRTTYLDATCYSPSPTVRPSEDDSFYIATYLSGQDTSGDVSFGAEKQFTQQQPNGLPPSSFQVDHPSEHINASLLYMPFTDGISRIGAFYCEATRGHLTTKITTIVLNGKENVHIRPAVLTKTVSVGDTVTLEMRAVRPPSIHRRWRHNGGPFIGRSHGSLTLTINGVCPSDAGIYECHIYGYESRKLHGYMKLIVRGCPAGRWGSDRTCSQLCPPCYNGGVCDDKSGQCICPPGFRGLYCEEVLGRNIFGLDGGQRCSNLADPHDGGCRGKLLCLPDPYGCSCAAGYKGHNCLEECDEGTYGADCRQTCHCAANVTCSKDTGECQGECATSYFGVNCQLTACPIGSFGTNCNQTCHCESSPTCHQNSGRCEGACAESYFGFNCQQQAFNGVTDLLGYPSPDEPGALVLTWERDSASLYTVAYELINQGQCHVMTSPERVFVSGAVLPGDRTRYTLRNMEPSSTFRLYVQSHYGVRSNMATEVHTEATTAMSDGPVPVTNLKAVPSGPTSLLISWSPVRCAALYHVSLELTGRGRCSGGAISRAAPIYVNTTDTSIDQTDLEPFATYAINGIATLLAYAPADWSTANESDTSIYCSTTSPVIEPHGNISVASSAPTSLLLTWIDLPCDKHNGPLEGYQYVLRSTTNETVAMGTTTQTRVRISGLLPCSGYQFQVASLVTGATGVFSSVLTTRTSTTVPGLVTNLTAEGVSSSQVSISWNTPQPHTCDVDAYAVKYMGIFKHGCSGAASSPRNAGGSVVINATFVELVGLLPASQYQVSIKASNSAGYGQETSLTFYTEESAPTGPPRDAMILSSIAEGSLGFSWSRPLCGDHHGEIVRYHYRLIDIDNILVESAGNVTTEWARFNDLQLQTDFTFEVAACTAVGCGPYSSALAAAVKQECRPMTNAIASRQTNPKPVRSDSQGHAVAVMAVFCVVLVVAMLALVVRLRYTRKDNGRFSVPVKWSSSKDTLHSEILAEDDGRIYN